MDTSYLLYTPVFYFLFYVVLINVYGFIIMGIDKWKSSRKGWRIPEKRLFIIALSGGAAGILMGMKFFHHKTLHNKFKYGIPFILLVNTAVIGYILYLTLY